MARLEVEIGAKIDKLLSELNKSKVALKSFGTAADKVKEKFKKVGESMSKVGKSMATYLTLPLAAIATASIKMASDFAESLNKVDVAFKTSSKEVRAFGKTTLETFGIAEGTALDMAALFGDMATSMGLPVDKASKLSTSMVGLAGDLSSFKNVGIKEVTTALNGVFTGETESLKMLGIVMTETNLKQFALKKGMSGNIKTMTQAQKVQLRYAYILDKTKNAQGDFARTSDGSANQMRIFSESVKELSVSFGNVLLPLFTKIITQVNKVIKGFTALSPETKKIIVIIASLVAVVGPLLIALGFLSTTIIPALITGFGILLGPIGLITAAIVGLAIVVYKNFDAIIVKISEFYNSFVDVYNQSALLRGAIAGIGFQFETLFIVAKLAFKNIWAYIKTAGSNMINLFKNVYKVISGALTFNLSTLKEGLAGVKNSLVDTFSKIGEEVSKNSKEAAEQISKNFNKALDTTINGHLEKKTPEQIKKSLSSLANSLKDTAKKAGEAVGSVFNKGVESKTTTITPATTSTSANPSLGVMPIAPSIETEQFDLGAEQMMTKLQEFNEAANSLISGSISNTFSNIGSSIGEALASGGNVLGAVGNAVLEGLGNFLSEMGGMLVKYGTLAVLKGKLDLAILAGGPVAIGAGIAAIAVGVALSAAGAAIGSLSSGGSSGGGGQRRGDDFSGAGSSNFSGSSGGGNFGASSSSGGGDVIFRLAGTDLVGSISKTLQQNRDLGGNLRLI